MSPRSYFALFECAPVAIWHEDLSDVRAFLDAEGATNAESVREFLSASPGAIYECIRRIRVVHVNRMARTFYGAESEKELIAKLPDMFDSDALATLCAELAHLAGGATAFEAELETRTLAGEARVVRMNVSVVSTPDRPWSRVIVAFTDLTERRRLEMDLLQAQKLDSLGRLAGGVAHDLNNALMIINGYSDLLLSSASQSSETHEALTEIRKAGERAAALTQQLLAFSRKQVLQPVVSNLNTIVLDSHNVLCTATGEHIEVSLQLAPDLPLTRVDPAQMHHVLLNLVLNARDAMPRGGRLLIRTASTRLDSIAAAENGVTPGDYVTLTVLDTGVGMDEDTCRKVFEPFFTTKGPGKGTGLGLSSAFGIIKQSGGTMKVSSVVGEGSTFDVLLPVTADLWESSRQPVNATRGAPVGEHVLVVEDQPSVRRFLADALRRYGYTVWEAENATRALDCFEEHGSQIKVVVTDVVMPGIAGPELVRALIAKSPALRAVLISGYPGPMHASVEQKEDGSIYMQKPFAAEALADAVRKALEGRTVGANPGHEGDAAALDDSAPTT